MNVLYQDSLVLITDHSIIIKNYYFPSGQSKVVYWQQVKSVSVEPLTLFTGKGRAWGMGIKPYWFHCDWKRFWKKFMFVFDTGNLIKPALTPDDFDAAKAAIEKVMTIS
jgi:hypothetical protein